MQKLMWTDFFLMATALAMIVGFHAERDQFAKVNLKLIPPPVAIEKFVFGYDETVADMLWLRLLQDFYICEEVEDGIARKPDAPEREHSACHFGWVFKMVNAVTTLAPKWRQPHSVGPLMLSVVVDDREGATAIFERAIERFPNDYNILFNASYHFIWMDKNPQRAAELLVRAARGGGPQWFYSLAGKLYSEAGRIELAEKVLKSALEQNLDGVSKERVRQRLAQVESMRSLQGSDRAVPDSQEK